MEFAVVMPELVVSRRSFSIVDEPMFSLVTVVEGSKEGIATSSVGFGRVSSCHQESLHPFSSSQTCCHHQWSLQALENVDVSPAHICAETTQHHDGTVVRMERGCIIVLASSLDQKESVVNAS